MGIEWTDLAVGALAGSLVGFAYFGGLWLTVRRAVRARRPRSLLALSTVLRLAAALGAFYALLQLGPLALAGGMVGFLLVRQGWLRRVGPVVG